MSGWTLLAVILACLWISFCIVMARREMRRRRDPLGSLIRDSEQSIADDIRRRSYRGGQVVDELSRKAEPMDWDRPSPPRSGGRRPIPRTTNAFNQRRNKAKRDEDASSRRRDDDGVVFDPTIYTRRADEAAMTPPPAQPVPDVMAPRTPHWRTRNDDPLMDGTQRSGFRTVGSIDDEGAATRHSMKSENWDTPKSDPPSSSDWGSSSGDSGGSSGSSGDSGGSGGSE